MSKRMIVKNKVPKEGIVVLILLVFCAYFVWGKIQNVLDEVAYYSTMGPSQKELYNFKKQQEQEQKTREWAEKRLSR